MAKRRTQRRKEEPVNFWEGLFFKFGSKAVLGLLIIVVFLTVVQCTVKKPEAPTWTTNFVVPVINRTYDMNELIERISQDEIFIDSTGDVAFSVTEDLDTVYLDQSDLSTTDLSYSFAEQLGPIDIDPPSINAVSVSLQSVAGLASGLPGDSADISAMDFDLFNDMPQITSFSQATISNGTMYTIVGNNLGIDLDTVVVRVHDVVSGSDVAVDTFATPILSGETDSLAIGLAGRTLSNSLRLDVFAYTPGGVVSNVSAREISSDISFSSQLTVSAATAEVPALDDIGFSQRVGLDLSSGDRIDSAQLNSGQLDITITNGTGLASDIEITLANLRNGGVPVVINRTVPAYQSVQVSNGLSGYTLVPQQDSVTLEAVASIPGSGGAMVAVNQSDSFTVDAALSGLGFYSVSGVFANSTADFGGLNQDLDVPDGFDNIELVTAMLTLEVENGVDLPGTLDIVLNGSNGKSLNITGTIDPRGTGVSQISTITNNDVADFLFPLPESVDITGSVEFGDGVYQSTITENDYVFARVHIYAPLEVRVNNAEITDIDIESSDLDPDDMDIITDHFIEGRFIYEITNHLPLGITAIIHVSGDSASLYGSPDLTLDTIFAAPALVSLATGTTVSDSVTIGELVLDSLDIQVLDNDSLFIRPEIYLTGSDTSGVRLTDQDYFTIRGRIEVEYRFDGEF